MVAVVLVLDLKLLEIRDKGLLLSGSLESLARDLGSLADSLEVLVDVNAGSPTRLEAALDQSTGSKDESIMLTLRTRGL